MATAKEFRDIGYRGLTFINHRLVETVHILLSTREQDRHVAVERCPSLPL
jgi:hypothetical protein